MNALKLYAPPSRSGVIVMSIGSSVPSRCSAVISRRRLKTRPSPVSTKRCMPLAWAARSDGGMIVRAGERTMAIAAGQPNISSARAFHAVIRPSASIAM